MHEKNVYSCSGSEGQSIHKDFLHDWWRRYQILQLQVKDSLQSLCAQGPQFRKFSQETRQIIGLCPGLFRCTAV